MSGSPCRFLAGKDAISDGHFNGMTALLPPFSISQNPAKDQALAALPPALHKIMYSGLSISATPLRPCLPFSWTTLQGEHCRHLIVVTGVVDTFRQGACKELHNKAEPQNNKQLVRLKLLQSVV